MKPQPSSDPAALRRAAEARLKSRPATRPPETEADLRQLQHELEVHQIELEMQNEELRASQAEIKAGLSATPNSSTSRRRAASTSPPTGPSGW